jgi:hypothetical protein
MLRNAACMVITLAIFFSLLVTMNVYAAPAVTGTPTVDVPKLLQWTKDKNAGVPDLTEETANRLVDLHGQFEDCELVLSTAGNYHMALVEFWYNVFLPKYAPDLKDWYFTTSPPVAMKQIENKNITFGNMSLKCIPQVVVGPQDIVSQVKAGGFNDGEPVVLFKNRGNVILVKKGNPRHIRSIWDLGRSDVNVVTPNPSFEKNTFNNYSNTIYDVAMSDGPNAPAGWTADKLFNSIFNSGQPGKWLVGSKIHHREMPWSIAFGKADAGVLFYHLALNAVRTFPDMFEIVPLGGTIENPVPLPGNRIGTHYMIKIKSNWTPRQMEMQGKLFNAFGSPEFTTILERNGLTR